MKTIISIFLFTILLLSCNKELFVYNVYELEKCLIDENHDEVNHEIFKFNEGFFFYENCQGYKEIDGVKVNWLEDQNCPKWKGVGAEPLKFPENKRGKLIDSLTNDLNVPQRFFLVFLDDKRLLYFTNYEASKYFKKRVKTIYKNLNASQLQLDSLIKNNTNVEKLDSILLAHFKKEGWSESDFTFANYNLFNWDNTFLTFNQEVPLKEKNWRRSMKGVYKLYKNETGFYLKAAFDRGTLKLKDPKRENIKAEGIIELTFRSVNLIYPNLNDDTFINLELVEMNIPDSSVNLKGIEDKGSRRRNLIIKNTFAIRPIFSFHREPLKLSYGDLKINQMIVENDPESDKYKETWILEDGSSKVEKIKRNKGWWEE